MVIKCVISTDMALHFGKQATLKVRLAAEDLEPKGKDRMELLTFAFHMSDISTSARKFEIFEKWTECIYGEFFYQGDLERKKGVPINFLCDRKIVNQAE